MQETATITASQAGNANYLAATPVSQSLTVNPAGSGGGSGGSGDSSESDGTSLLSVPELALLLILFAGTGLAFLRTSSASGPRS